MSEPQLDDVEYDKVTRMGASQLGTSDLDKYLVYEHPTLGHITIYSRIATILFRRDAVDITFIDGTLLTFAPDQTVWVVTNMRYLR